ncbi:MAG: exo-alpha-sialidase [Bacteroidetes bacterium]|nr:exo-alpha-sialidase [Bacteroidota bacterium]
MQSFHFFYLILLLPGFISCQQAQTDSIFNFSYTAVGDKSNSEGKTTTTSIVFQSTDGGQSWQDISAGLPAGIKPWLFFAGNGELILGDEKGNYTTSTTANPPSWEKEMALQQQLFSVSANPNGPIAIKTNGQFFQKLKGTDVWLPIFTDFKSTLVRSVFTAKDGSIFISADDGLFKSTDDGKTWKHIVYNGWVLKIVESDGVLLCTNQGGILRSTDGGEHWDKVLSKGGVGIAVEPIKSGFAAIVYEHGSESRRICTSYDGGKTWQTIDDGLPPSKLISSIKQVGDYLYCGHPEGIYRTANLGKTWELILPNIDEKVFNLTVDNGVMYAVLREGGC